MAVVCSDCEGVVDEAQVTAEQLRAAADIADAAKTGGTVVQPSVWVRSGGWGLMAVRHYKDTGADRGYVTALIDKDGKTVHETGRIG